MKITCCHFGSPPPPHSENDMEYCNKCKDWWDNITGISSSSRSRNSRLLSAKKPIKAIMSMHQKILEAGIVAQLLPKMLSS